MTNVKKFISFFIQTNIFIAITMGLAWLIEPTDFLAMLRLYSIFNAVVILILIFFL